jgi:hypothetical protein
VSGAERARCGCPLVSCDPCGKLVPRGETLQLGPEQSGAAQCDTTCCAACRGADPADVHPTCETCGSCDACSCAPDAFAPPTDSPEDRLRMQDMLTEDYE